MYLDTGLKVIKRIKSRLERYYPGADISSRKISMVSVIGSDMNVPGILARISQSLAESNISVLAIHQGMRQVDIRLVVEDDQYEAALKLLHETLIEPNKQDKSQCVA